MKLIDRYRGMVHRHYSMNPNTEWLVQNAADLQNGMVVLVAGVVHRHEIIGKNESDFVNFNAVLMANRWCTVKNISVSAEFVSFVGVYPDGREVQRVCPRNTAWLVKKNPVIDDEAAPMREMWERIHSIVMEAFEENEALVRRPDYPADEVTILSGETTDKLMKAMRS